MDGKGKKGIRRYAVLFALVICLCWVSPAQAAFDTSIDSFECRGMTVPAYDGDPYEVVNNNETSFTEVEKAAPDFEASYSDLDEYGRVGTVFANIDQSKLPTGERGDISSIYPTGWVQKKYDTSIVSGGWLYNRSHLYAFSLGGEDTKENLCTGTRSFNVQGMYNSSESPVLSYVKSSEDHVLYRVTPVFFGEELLPRGVLIEAESLETEDINICVFCYNVQPGIALDYMTGDNILGSEIVEPDPPAEIIDMSSVSISAVRVKVYSGKAIKPSLELKDSDGNILAEGTDYTVSFKNNVKPGRATITINGAGRYKGTKTVRFYIKPKKMAALKVKAAKRQAVVRWSKHPGVTGYQIAYKKKGAKKYKVLTAKSTSTKKVIKKLKRGKRYQFKIRAYKKADGKTLYGAYSNVRTVKVR